MAYVEELEELAASVGPGRVVAVGDLPPAGDAGPARQELVAGIAELVGLLKRHGARADDGEVTGQHIQELRKLVERGVAQEPADARDARIVVELLLALPGGKLLGSHVLLGVLVGVGDHGAQLEDVDLLAVLANALLPEEGLAGRVHGYRHARGGNRDGQDHAHASREQHVKGALDGKVAGTALLGGLDRGIGRRSHEGRCRGICASWRILLCYRCFFC